MKATLSAPRPVTITQPSRYEILADTLGAAITRYGIVALLLLFGAMKWTAAEAQGIQPLISHSPFFGWLYAVLGLQGTSIFFGCFEIAAAILIASRPFLPLASAVGSAFCVIMFLTTLSFLFTTPGIFASPMAGFIMKDIVLLGGAFWTAGEALGAARERRNAQDVSGARSGAA